jgi:hypothetical protein
MASFRQQSLTPSPHSGGPQAALDGLDGAKVGIVPLMPGKAPPRLQRLVYLAPKARPRKLLAANDVAATRIVWAADRDALVRDPDGHFHLLRQSPRPSLDGDTPPASERREA